MAFQKRKLLLTGWVAGIGGVTTVMLSIARGMTARNIQTQTLLPESPRTEEALKLFWAEHLEAGADDVLSPTSWGNVPAFARTIRRSQADVVNLHFGGNWASCKNVLSVLLAGKRCVATIHHATPLIDKHRIQMTRLAGRLSHAIIVSTEYMRSLLVEAGVPAHKMVVIPCSAPKPTHFPVREDARARWRIPQEAFVVGVLARHEPHKGIADLIRAFALLPKSEPPMRLMVAGDGPERPALERLAQELAPERVLFVGRIPETADFYAALDLFVLPSYEEGFGLVYIEAAFHGIPSIGTCVGGVPTAIQEGKTGMLVAPGDIDSLAGAIQKLRNDSEQRRRLGGAARERAFQEFTEEKMITRYEQALFYAKPA
jgi:glycosyltransferase involved in cell wall biosynthesis